VLQLPLEQEPHADEPDDGVKLSPLLKAADDIRRLTLSPLQAGQFTFSSLRKSRISNSSEQFEHLYS
jgi:hypothetical protein